MNHLQLNAFFGGVFMAYGTDVLYFSEVEAETRTASISSLSEGSSETWVVIEWCCEISRQQLLQV